MVSYYGKNGKTKSLRQTVFALLDQNPHLTGSTICNLLELPFEKYGNYFSKLKCEWKTYRENEQGSKCSGSHGWRGYCCVPFFVDRGLALGLGWKRSRNRNGCLIWSDGFGRMEWFRNGRVRLWVRKPSNLGRTNQLVCNGFFKTGLIDLKFLDQIINTVRNTEEHFTFETDLRLPRKTIDFFEKKYGIIIKVGDKSHPRAVEVVAKVPDWAERLELTLERIGDIFGKNSSEKDVHKRPDYVV